MSRLGQCVDLGLCTVLNPKVGKIPRSETESAAPIIPASPAVTSVSAASAVTAAASSGKPDEEFPDFGPISSALPLAGPANASDAAARATADLAAVEGAAALVAAGKAVVAPPVVLLHGPVAIQYSAMRRRSPTYSVVHQVVYTTLS